MPVDKRCSFCKSDVETVSHLFYYYPFIQIAKHFLVQWFRDIGGHGVSLECIRFSVFKDTSFTEERKALLILLSEYRLSVWLCRNKARFDGKRIRPINIATHFLGRVKFRLYTDFCRLSRECFEDFWSKLCLIEDNELKFIFSLSV